MPAKQEGGIPSPPPDRGRLWYDREIPAQFLGDLPGVKNKVRWVREHFPRASRVRIGQASAWYEKDIVAHMAAARGGALRRDAA